MNTWIALYRGINVGGHNSLPMKALQALLEKNGCVGVRTYIQSGNVVFESPLRDAAAVEAQLTKLVARSRGFAPRVLVLSRREFERAAASNPLPEAKDNPKSVHLFFLATPPSAPDRKGLDALRSGRERFVLKSKVLYVYTPDGFGKSKLGTRAERLLGVDATARNWNTVTALLELVAAS